MSAGYVKTILCLANSRKLAGRCVAGKEIAGDRIGAWIRPVSARPAGELSLEDRQFNDGQDPRLLDVITIRMTEPRPDGFQVENHLIDDGYYWTRVRETGWRELRAALDPVSGVLWDNSSSSSNGLNDRVRAVTGSGRGGSLRLVEVSDLRIAVAFEGSPFGNAKRKVRGHFTLNGAEYRLSVTDPVIEGKYLAGASGVFKVGHAILCISLGETYKGYAYKLIAGVFLQPMRG
jgi:hypothetical protein